MQTKLDEEDAEKINRAADMISDSFVWAETDEGHEYWADVVEHLLNKAANRTSDGKPYIDPEPPIPDGYRKANADEWTRKDVKYWDVYRKDWRPRITQGVAFDPPVMQTRYIVPIDPPLTDEDACVWPRLLVMVRDKDSEPWKGPFRYFGKDDDKACPFVAVSAKGRSQIWQQARRATPEEIEAAK